MRTGPFVTCIRSPLRRVAEALGALYGDFPIVSDPEFVDCYANVVRAGGIRRWLFPRAYFMTRGEHSHTFGRFPIQLAPAFLEWGVNYCIYGEVNYFLILHAAVLERHGGALIILGDSGAGKSTLCATLTLSGWRLLSDEMALIGLSDGLIYPIARPISLKNESIATIQRFAADASFGPICRTPRKGLVAHLRPPTDSVRRMDEPASPRWIVYVHYNAGAALSIEEVPRAKAFIDLVYGAFNYSTLGATGFRLMCQMLDRSDCRRIRYSNLNDAITHFDSSLYRAA